MLAYYLPGLSAAAGVDHVPTTRLAIMGKFHFLDDNAGGCIAYLKGWDMATATTPRPTKEGWKFSRNAHLPDISTLQNQTHPESDWVTLANGRKILVPLAQKSPRQMSFEPGGGRWGDHIEDWALRAFELFAECEEATTEHGARYLRVCSTEEAIADILYRAISTVYRVTPELMSDMLQMRASDLVTCIQTVWGLNPKVWPGVGSDSALPPGTIVMPSN
jgi:hypothetical protein